MSDLAKRRVCAGLGVEAWRAWEVGEALMTPRETPSCSLTSGHWEMTCAPRHPPLGSCLDSSACEGGVSMRINKAENQQWN